MKEWLLSRDSALYLIFVVVEIERKRKLPASRVGANFDHQGASSTTWLPSFGRVWNNQRRLNSRSVFLRYHPKFGVSEMECQWTPKSLKIVWYWYYKVKTMLYLRVQWAFIVMVLPPCITDHKSACMGGNLLKVFPTRWYVLVVIRIIYILGNNLKSRNGK